MQGQSGECAESGRGGGSNRGGSSLGFGAGRGSRSAGSVVSPALC